jgi:hypothetical protein
MIGSLLSYLLLAAISTATLAVGCFLYVSQAWSDPQASLHIRIIGIGLVIAGLAGDAFAIWGIINTMWKATA